MHKNKFTESLDIVDNKYRIVETINLTKTNCEKVNISEDKIICEGKELNTSKQGFRFKVWNNEFNYNGRNYKNVIPIALKQNLKTVSLMNHPTEDADVRDICGVTKDWKMDNDGWCSVLFIPCGDYGKLITDVINAEGPISVSSSILGDVDDDGYITVEDYVLERALDIVFSPSNGLNHYKDHVEYQNEDGSRNLVAQEGCVQESKDVTILTNKEENTDSVTVTSDTDNAESENKGECSMENKELAEASLKLNLKSMIKEAKSTTDLYAKKEILESADLYAKQLNDEGIISEIETELVATEDEIKNLSIKGLETDELNATIETLKKENDELKEKCKALEDEKLTLEGQFNTVSEMYESKQYKCSEKELEKSHNLSKEICALKIKSRKQERVISALKKRNAKLNEQIEFTEATLNTMVDADEYAKIIEEKELVKKSLREMRIKSLKEGCDNEEDRLASLKKRLHKVDNDVVEDEVIENDEIVVEEDDEDLTMMKMLGAEFEEDEVMDNEVTEEDEDLAMEKMLNR